MQIPKLSKHILLRIIFRTTKYQQECVQQNISRKCNFRQIGVQKTSLCRKKNITLWTQGVNWTYITHSEDVLGIVWTSYVSSVYTLCPRGNITVFSINRAPRGVNLTNSGRDVKLGLKVAIGFLVLGTVCWDGQFHLRRSKN